MSDKSEIFDAVDQQALETLCRDLGLVYQ